MADSGQVALVLDYMDGGSLASLLAKTGPKDTRKEKKSFSPDRNLSIFCENSLGPVGRSFLFRFPLCFPYAAYDYGVHSALSNDSETEKILSCQNSQNLSPNCQILKIVKNY